MGHRCFLHLRAQAPRHPLVCIAESSNIVPALWRILLADARPAPTAFQAVFGDAGSPALEAEARPALGRFERFVALALRHPALARDAALPRALEATGHWLREQVEHCEAEAGGRPALFCADLDEITGLDDSAVDAAGSMAALQQDFADGWRALELEAAAGTPHGLDELLGFASFRLGVGDWMAWCRIFGLGGLEHPYFAAIEEHPPVLGFAEWVAEAGALPALWAGTGCRPVRRGARLGLEDEQGRPLLPASYVALAPASVARTSPADPAAPLRWVEIEQDTADGKGLWDLAAGRAALGCHHEQVWVLEPGGSAPAWFLCSTVMGLPEDIDARAWSVYDSDGRPALPGYYRWFGGPELDTPAVLRHCLAAWSEARPVLVAEHDTGHWWWVRPGHPPRSHADQLAADWRGGDLRAALRLARDLYDGRGLEADREAAHAWAARAAGLVAPPGSGPVEGLPPGMALYAQGLREGRGGAPDLPGARVWAERALADGETGPALCLLLGRLLLDRAAGPPEPGRALGLFRHAAAQLDEGSTAQAEARRQVGELLLRAEAAEALADARAWLEQAAEAGDRRAMERLAQDVYGNPAGTCHDPKRAAHWEARAAQVAAPAEAEADDRRPVFFRGWRVLLLPPALLLFLLSLLLQLGRALWRWCFGRGTGG
ncbi:hypothetical protein OOT46_01660 [Aquabacterium sp. A7-Y]|uniref:hypothetical protein n=1 Tax=Aquabacterium sp. A7-Y TaxID=1349605 RepID=UPI00223E288A|nr:hypothetical protein [Aquabacterium sp. A7-Y]MCW7536562.1 hypothetical protein [Aquabacterium sp. A7-Y]